ncbi:MAG: GNAT family N-acetyltransferase [Clostridia bacterium]|nr:GNAT family N-acetyltransferase [Clostridia bacterium]
MLYTPTFSDIPQLKKIWQDIFLDSDAFVDWFFTERFDPSLSFCEKTDGKIISCLHGYRLPIILSGKEYPAVIIAGVSTLPQYRGMGIAKNLLKEYMKKMYSIGDIAVAFYTPVNPDIYKFLGHMPFSRAIKAENCRIEKPKEIFDISPLKLTDLRLYDCYKTYSKSYSGIVARKDYFSVKMRDYSSSQLTCLGALRGEKVMAYAIYNDKTGKCEECIGDLSALSYIFSTGTFSAMLPPDFPTEKLKGDAKLVSVSMGGVVNAQLFLKTLSAPCPFNFFLNDDIVKENSGVYDFKGNKKKKPADFSLSSGSLLQLVSGYFVPEKLNSCFEIGNCYTLDLY